MSTSQRIEKKSHVCPPSNAIHPSDRWESLFVYSFICKFTSLRHKVEGLESPMDLEGALMSKEPNSILSQVLANFIVNLKPQTRNLSTDQISTTVASVLAEYCKSSERTIFWNEDLKANIDPFEGLEGGFFTTDWDFKAYSPRIYVSTNPWKTTATFQSISTTREDYVAVVESLKAATPPEPKKGQKRTKLEQSHLLLIEALENRLETIDAELVDDGADEYTYQEEGQDEDEQDYMNGSTRRGRSGVVATRRSTRTSAINANGKREGSSDSGIWRGERRSTRLGGPDYSLDMEPSRKRARTEESTSSAHSTEQSLPPDNVGVANGVRVKTTGAAALKPTEVALEQIAGKKKSKYWVYAVEPIPGATESTPSPSMNGHGVEMNGKDRSSPPRTNGHSNQMEGLEGNSSAVHSP
ncbi:hypothetical protein NLJ89_g1340 [Agrocybe chaxingu]|uniref:Uncharacterized protein n=1 Tax=Agrocybe chaxingu TaxID=84603 RepID=A0A9W8N0C3_9AGAR|nr:hypothetical protein NLJ89_g1340 [Agrocybe chaxingu]